MIRATRIRMHFASAQNYRLLLVLNINVEMNKKYLILGWVLPRVFMARGLTCQLLFNAFNSQRSHSQLQERILW